MGILCVIPSRIASTRLPRKPLLLIQGKPMIQWVYENASRCRMLDELVVATDSDEIAAVVRDFGGNVCLTDPELPTGSDRVATVARDYPEHDVVINLQGDEPFIRPRMLEQLVVPFVQENPPLMTTVAYPFLNAEEFADPGVVKVITDTRSDAIYFSRAQIPYFREQVNVPVYHHMGLYAFRREFLLTYTTLEPTPLSLAEALEQLRAMEHGYKIRVCLTTERTLEINTPEEYEAAQHFQYVE